MASGLCYIEKKGQWIYENIASKNHIRGPLKAYRKDCFEAIGGLKESIGWDTIDELLALYNGWGFKTDETLIVKHLKPTTINYNIKARNLQGKALYIIRSGIMLSILSLASCTIYCINSSVYDFDAYKIIRLYTHLYIQRQHFITGI